MFAPVVAAAGLTAGGAGCVHFSTLPLAAVLPSLFYCCTGKGGCRNFLTKVSTT